MKHKFQNPILKAMATRLVALDQPRMTVREYAADFGILMEPVSEGNLAREANKCMEKIDLDTTYTPQGRHTYPEIVLKRVFKPVFKAIDAAAKEEVRGG